MQLDIQKIYFLFAFSYIIYFLFTLSNYKYNIFKTNYKNNIAILFSIFIVIILIVLFFGIKESYVWDGKDWSEPGGDTLSKEKKLLIIKEGLFKTKQWKNKLIEYLKYLNNINDVSIKNAKDIIAFFYGSNVEPLTREIGDDTTDVTNTPKPPIKWQIIPNYIKNILNLDDKGIVIDGNKKNLESLEKKKLIFFILKRISKIPRFFEDNNEELTKEGMEYFKTLKDNIPKSVLEDRLEYFINSDNPANFDIIFTIFGGRNIYTNETSILASELGGGGDVGDENPELRKFVRRSYRIAKTTGEFGLGFVSTGSTGPGRAAPGSIASESSENQESVGIKHNWGFQSGNSNDVHNGGLLKEPLEKASDVIRSWIPVAFEFFDKDIPDNYIESTGGGYYYKGDKDGPDNHAGYKPGVIISSVGAATKPSEDEYSKDRTLNSLVLNTLVTTIDRGDSAPPAVIIGYPEFLPWLKNISLLKLKKHRDIITRLLRAPGDASNLYNSDDPEPLSKENGKNDDNIIYRINGLTRLEKDAQEDINKKKTIYNLPDDFPSLSVAPPDGDTTVGGAARPELPVLNVNNEFTNYLKRVTNSFTKYNDLYDTLINDDDLKHKLSIDLLNNVFQNVSLKDKKEYSSTNYEYIKKIEKSKNDDYISEIINFSVYFSNLNIFVILVTLMAYLSSYKNKTINNLDITENDKNIFNDSINRQIKYTRIFIIIFVIVSLFSFSNVKKYIKLLKTIITSDGNIFNRIFNTINQLYQYNKKKTIFISIVVLLILIGLYFTTSTNISSSSQAKEGTRLKDLFIKDLNRTDKNTSVSERKSVPTKNKDNDKETKNKNYICYSSKCNNDDIKIKNNPKYKLFYSLKDCQNSGCELNGITNSGISALNYNFKNIV